VPGGFLDADDADLIWDFACCFDGKIYLYTCGEVSLGCDMETFECEYESATSSSTGG
jgi:hypothetical protein